MVVERHEGIYLKQSLGLKGGLYIQSIYLMKVNAFFVFEMREKG